MYHRSQAVVISKDTTSSVQVFQKLEELDDFALSTLCPASQAYALHCFQEHCIAHEVGKDVFRTHTEHNAGTQHYTV